MARAALRIEVTTKDRKELQRLLSGGVQQVRVVLRAITLLQLAKGVSAPQIAGVAPRVGRETIRILLLSHNLKPWREKMWCVAELNEDYIAKIEDVLETCERPYDPQEPVICLDEKPVTLHADVRPASPAKPGREARQDNEHERRGANVFCAVEPKAGRHFTFATPDRSGAEFAKVAFELALQYPPARTIA